MLRQINVVRLPVLEQWGNTWLGVTITTLASPCLPQGVHKVAIQNHLQSNRTEVLPYYCFHSLMNKALMTDCLP